MLASSIKMKTAIATAFLLVAATRTSAQPAPDQDPSPDPSPDPMPDQWPEPPPRETVPAPPDPDVYTSSATVEPVVPPTPSTTRESAYDRFRLLTFTIGGGVSGFTENTLRDTTDAGGSWTARIGMNLSPSVALEASYLGSVQTIDTLGIDDSTLLVGNGAELVLRLNGPTGAGLTPFLFGGAGWRHYSLTNTDTNTSAVEDSDEVFEFPLGIGLSTPVASNVFIDLRGELRYVVDSDMVPNFEADASPNDDAEMHRWGVNLTVGIAL